nr:dienelactone hydrolase family protein [Marinomonas ostreistagni]
MQYLTVDTGDSPEVAVIWLHGLGADCHDFEGLVPQLNLGGKAVRFILPNAPMRPVTINGGMPMRAWYDILEMTLERKVDMANIEESAEQIEQIIEDLAAQGISSDNVIMAGFSQGGVIAYQVALRGNYKLAGVMALSTYLADASALPEAATHSNGAAPFLIHHGNQDNVVSPILGGRANEQLQARGFTTQYQVYDMPHAVCPEQVQDIAAWLTQRFAS